MGVSQAFFIFPLFLQQISKDSLKFIKKEVSAVQSDLIVSKDVVMKDILKYSYKYLTFEVIQGIRIFQNSLRLRWRGGGGGGIEPRSPASKATILPLNY